ncbi:hypothetical protein EI94DRAFT_1789295 [Lactarius quietus]|nr:hypothetical protein EI94DRAFT_1789295 [Lactarius quietus]
MTREGEQKGRDKGQGKALRTKGLQKDLSKSYLWGILEKLLGIKELELYLTGVDEWGSVWKISKATAFLPALRRVRIVADLKYVSPLSYAIIGDSDLPTRRIVRLPNPTEVDTISVLEAVSAEEELENMSGGLLRFFQGLVRRYQILILINHQEEFSQNSYHRSSFLGLITLWVAEKKIPKSVLDYGDPQEVWDERLYRRGERVEDRDACGAAAVQEEGPYPWQHCEQGLPARRTSVGTGGRALECDGEILDENLYMPARWKNGVKWSRMPPPRRELKGRRFQSM